jgi:hypothetical protein
VRGHRATRMGLRTYPLMPRYVFTGFSKRIPMWFDVFDLRLITVVAGIGGRPMKLDHDGRERAWGSIRMPSTPRVNRSGWKQVRSVPKAIPSRPPHCINGAGRLRLICVNATQTKSRERRYAFFHLVSHVAQPDIYRHRRGRAYWE